MLFAASNAEERKILKVQGLLKETRLQTDYWKRIIVSLLLMLWEKLDCDKLNESREIQYASELKYRRSLGREIACEKCSNALESSREAVLGLGSWVTVVDEKYLVTKVNLH